MQNMRNSPSNYFVSYCYIADKKLKSINMRIFRKVFGALPYLVFLVTIIASCNREQTVDLKKDEDVRQEVFKQILNDEELFKEFLTQMEDSRRSVEWMSANRPMMRKLYSRRQVQAMMQENPEVLDSIMQGMMTSMQRDTTRMRKRMWQSWSRRIERDTVMYRQMKERFQKHEEGRN
jgi:hypothetical protein